jgi:hypothetical protein
VNADEVAKAVAGYRVIRHRGTVFVQPRDADEAERLHALGASVSEYHVLGQIVREARLYPMLDEPTEVDEDGNVIDNRETILLDYFRERDGYSWPARAVSVNPDEG